MGWSGRNLERNDDCGLELPWRFEGHVWRTSERLAHVEGEAADETGGEMEGGCGRWGVGGRECMGEKGAVMQSTAVGPSQGRSA